MKRVFGVYVIFIFLFVELLYPQNLELVGHIVVQPGQFVTDVWGYADTVHGKEYAIVGSFGGMEIIDVTDPQNPQQVFSSNSLPGFDMKVWKNYLYLVTGSGGANLGKILDITNPASPIVVNSFNSAHNIFISKDGYLFAESPGLIVYNLNNTPTNPQFVWSDNTGGGHDATVIKNRVYDFHGDATNVYDYTTTSNFTAQLLGTINNPQIQYHHSGWITEDDKYLFICDELSNHPTSDITVWDINNLQEPVKVDEYADPDATVHNLYIIGNYAYVSYYTAGFRVFDISDPENIKVADHYDTSPASGQGFDGAFGVYPFLPSGNILVSDQTGLYIFKFNKPTGIDDDINSPSSFELHQNYPNPFNPVTKIKFTIQNVETRHASSQLITLKVYDVLGREVATLINEEKPAGVYEIEFRTSVGSLQLASGVYYYQLKAGEFAETKKMILLK